MRIQVMLEVKTGEPGSEDLVYSFDLIFDAGKSTLRDAVYCLAGMLTGFAQFYLQHIPDVVSLEVINYSEEVT